MNDNATIFDQKNEIRPVSKTGDSCSFRVKTSFREIINVLGFEPNVTEMDDTDKVSASWGFEVYDDDIDQWIRCGVWNYRSSIYTNSWSFFGPRWVAEKLFGE